jgi:hypothetical protein
MTSDFVEMTQAYAIPIKLVKNNWGTRQKWWGGKWNHNYCRVGSMSLLNMALSAFVSGWGYLISYFHLLPWVWVILFDLSSAHCLVTMTSDHLMSNTANSTVVPPICSREVDLCKVYNLPLIVSHNLDSQHYLSVSCR